MADWTWDPAKNRTNLAKHGLDFALAQHVFDDPLALTRFDMNYQGEDRWQTIGMIGAVAILVAHTAPETGAPGRVISARKATRHERKLMKKANSKKLTAAQAKQLGALSAMRDAEIDFSDIPEQVNWKGAKRGVFYKPVKQQLTLRLDADVVDWFKRQGEGYQTRINAVLRKHVGRKAG